MKISRATIQVISRHSNWSKNGIQRALESDVYADAKAWRLFLRLFLISLGVGFATAGIIFFFAYNWADLPKFAKIGIVEGLIVLVTVLALYPKLNGITQQVLLTGASVLVGVLFAVFGQIYQTGANAYDFFLGWTVFVTCWVLVSHFPPLWLIYLLLINTTFYLFTDQVAMNWSWLQVSTWLFVGNSFFMLAFAGLSLRMPQLVPAWFVRTLAFACVCLATECNVSWIADDYAPLGWVACLWCLLLYGLGIWYSFHARNIVYLAMIPFSLIVIVTTALLCLSKNDITAMLFFVSIFIVISITLVIRELIRLQKEWAL
jgi:uncharacterized membrane protein